MKNWPEIVFNLSARAAVPLQKFCKKFGSQLIFKGFGHFDCTFLTFTDGKKCKIWPRFLRFFIFFYVDIDIDIGGKL